MYQLRDNKVNEKHLAITINLFGKDKFLINEKSVLVYI
jgi:hypothetical protein